MFLRFFLFLLPLLFFNPSPIHALSLTDIFPPVNMKPSPKKEPPKTATSREVKSDDTYANGLNNNQECTWNINLDHTFDPQTGDTGQTNPDGSHIIGNIPREARDIVKTIDLDKPLSNNYFRNVHYFAARGEIECDVNTMDKPFKDFRPDGKNATVRSTPENILKYEKGLLIEQAILSLDPKNDVIGQDEQILWACSGECVKLSAIKSGCRPVTVADIGYYYYQKGKSPMYELLPYGQVKNIPYSAEALRILANFRSIFEKRFNRSFDMLRDGIYISAYRQLDPLPRIPENSKFKLTRFRDVNMTIGDTVVANRTLPNAGPATSEQARFTWSLYSPQNQKKLNNSDPCGNYAIVNQAAIDKPSPLGAIQAFVLGLFGWVFNDPLKITNKYNQASYKIEKTSVENAAVFEKSLIGLIPQSEQNRKNFKDKPSASKYSAETPIDVGYRANVILAGGQGSFSDIMQPASWKGSVVNRPPEPTHSPTPSGVPQPVQDWCSTIKKYSTDNNLPSALIAAVITVESGGNPNAISQQGAVGLMQVMPSDGIAAQFMCNGTPCFKDRPTTQELLNPDFNVSYGTALLKSMVDTYGGYREGLLHYGPANYGYTYADQVLNLFESNQNICP